jgi:hypothetical protein
MQGRSYIIVAKVRRVLVAAQVEDQPRRSKAENHTQQAGSQVAVVWIPVVVQVRRVTRREKVQNANIGKGITNGIHDKDTDNQQGENIISETRGQSYHASEVEKACQAAIRTQPYTDPGIEGEERHIKGLGHAVEHGGKGQDWTCGANDALRAHKLDK